MEGAQWIFSKKTFKLISVFQPVGCFFKENYGFVLLPSKGSFWKGFKARNSQFINIAITSVEFRSLKGSRAAGWKMSQSSKRFLPKSIRTISTFHKVVKNCKATPCHANASLPCRWRNCLVWNIQWNGGGWVGGWVGPNTATICILFLFNLDAGKELYSSLWLIF